MKNNLSTIIIWAQNKAGVLYRILWLFRRKQFNLESVTAGHTEIPGVSRITITVGGDKNQIHHIVKMVNKLANIVKAEDVSEEKLVSRELAMVKLGVKDRSEKLELLEVIKHFRGRLVSIRPDQLIIEVTGGEEKIDAFYENMKKYKILEFVRTGRTALFK